MNVFSIVSATIDQKVTQWLPPSQDLASFLDKLAGVSVTASVTDGQLRISGTLDAIISAEDSLRTYIQEKEEEESGKVIIIDVPAGTVVDPANVVIIKASEDNELIGEENNDEDVVGLAVEGSHTSEASGEDGAVNNNKPAEDSGASSIYKFHCSMCSFKSQREGQFRRHVLLHDTIKEIHECDQCDFRTLRATQLTRHKVSHSVVTLACPVGCGYTTDDTNLLVKHQKRTNHFETTDGDSDDGTDSALPGGVMRQCDRCPYKTDRLHRFQRHYRTHTAEDGRTPLVCPDCGFQTNKRTHYNRHVRDVHEGVRPHLCHTCGKAFKRADALRQHSLQHLNGPEEVADARLVAYQCPVCDRLCHSKNRLENHLAVHSSERAYLCEVCGAAFKTRSVHRKHVVNQHEKPSSFPCNICDRKFNTKYDLERHMKRKRHPTRTDCDGDKKRKKRKTKE